MKTKTIKNLVTTGFVGLAGVTLMGIQTNAAHAATVNYKDGATTVWSNPNNGQPIKYLTANQQVNIQNTQQVNGQTWCQVGANEWVPAIYLNTTQSSLQSSQAMTITANYQQGATTIWTAPINGQVAGYLACGQTAQVLGKQQVGNETYYHIQQGWVPAQYVTINGHATAAVTSQAVPTSVVSVASQAPVKVTTSSAASQNTNVTSQAVRSQANTNYSQNYHQNNVVQQANTTASQSYAQRPQTNNANGVVSRATAYLGTPYQWGGNQPGGFDCSGFVQYVYGLGNNYRTSQAQSTMGPAVSVNSLQPGDLCFWGQPGSAYHVGIWVGNGRYIAAPAPGQSVSYGSVQYYTPSFGIHMNR